ncbi:MAG TPA: NAD-dependent epimerase/dehydratase family protein [Candidatus Cybelea sp.]|jgi:nucleoside-diphosphate-sugar epimerase|nr:NAD-dependent epimerase/dehydratase family protein [Candidatus Cybelea sp.]
MPSVLVTGGAGFVGSHVVADLVGAGYRVAVLDNFSSGLRENLAAVIDDVEIIEGDVLNTDALATAARGKDILSHQAAQLEITKALENPLDDMRTNLVGTINVLEAARAAGVSRVVNASSACIYGQAVNPPSEEDAGPHNPNWSYGASKLAAEKYAQIFSNDYGFPVHSLRYGITYGPREWYGRVLTIFLKRLSEGKPPVVFGAGEQIRDFVFIDDVVRIHRACIESGLPGAQSFNAGTGIPTTVKELAALACEISGTGLEPIRENVEPGERSEIVDGRMRLPSELDVMQLSPVKVERTFGLKARVALRDGLKREWEWLRENPHRWTTMSY